MVEQQGQNAEDEDDQDDTEEEFETIQEGHGSALSVGKFGVLGEGALGYLGVQNGFCIQGLGVLGLRNQLLVRTEGAGWCQLALGLGVIQILLPLPLPVSKKAVTTKAPRKKVFKRHQKVAMLTCPME